MKSFLADLSLVLMALAYTFGSIIGLVFIAEKITGH